MEFADFIKEPNEKAPSVPTKAEIETMLVCRAALAHIDKTEAQLGYLFDRQAYPIREALVDAEWKIKDLLTDMLDELAEREFDGHGDPDSFEKIIPGDMDTIHERLERYHAADMDAIHEKLESYGIL